VKDAAGRSDTIVKLYVVAYVYGGAQFGAAEHQDGSQGCLYERESHSRGD
jgi:hypothetical protein